MSDLAAHRSRWIKNREFCRTLASEDADWMVTAIFYASVHAIGTLFVADRVKPPDTHSARFRVLRATNRYRQIYRHYKPIYDASIDSRYGCRPSVWMPADLVDADLLRGEFFPLEKSVCKLLVGEAPKLEPLMLQKPIN